MDEDDVPDMPILESDDPFVEDPFSEAVLSSGLEQTKGFSTRGETKIVATRRTPVINLLFCSATLSKKIDLKSVARRCTNAIYNPARSSGVLIGLHTPRCTATVHASGRVIFYGCRSAVSAMIAIRRLTRKLQRTLPNFEDVKVSDFQIHNVSASGSLGYRVNLNELASSAAHMDYADYRPDSFPGLVYKLPYDLLPARKSTKVENESSTTIKPVKVEQGKSESAKAAIAGTATSLSLETPSELKQSKELTIRLYFNGNFVFIGGRNEADIYDSFDYISSLFWPFADRSVFDKDVPTNRYIDWLKWAQSTELELGLAGWEKEEHEVTRLMQLRELKKSSGIKIERSNDIKPTEVEEKVATVYQTTIHQAATQPQELIKTEIPVPVKTEAHIKTAAAVDEVPEQDTTENIDNDIEWE